MKKAISFLLISLLAFTLAGCGDTAESAASQTPSEAAAAYLDSIKADPDLLLLHPSLKENGFPIFYGRISEIVGEILKDFEYEIISEEKLNENSFLVTVHIKAYEIGPYFRQYLEVPTYEYEEQTLSDPDVIEMIHQVYLDEGNDEETWQILCSEPAVLENIFFAAYDSGVITPEQEDLFYEIRDGFIRERLKQAMDECRANGLKDMEELTLQVKRDDKNSEWNVWRLADHLDVIGAGMVREYSEWSGGLTFAEDN